MDKKPEANNREILCNNHDQITLPFCDFKGLLTNEFSYINNKLP